MQISRSWSLFIVIVWYYVRGCAGTLHNNVCTTTAVRIEKKSTVPQMTYRTRENLQKQFKIQTYTAPSSGT